jgi:hypothetical protein
MPIFDVEKLAETEYPIFDGDLLGIAHNQEHRRFGFIAGYNKAKELTSSQTEIMYSEEEVLELLLKSKIETSNLYYEDMKEWFEQFKK